MPGLPPSIQTVCEKEKISGHEYAELAGHKPDFQYWKRSAFCAPSCNARQIGAGFYCMQVRAKEAPYFLKSFSKD